MRSWLKHCVHCWHLVRVNDTGSAVAFALVLGTWLVLTTTEVSFPFVPLLLTHSSSTWPVGNLEAEWLLQCIQFMNTFYGLDTLRDCNPWNDPVLLLPSPFRGGRGRWESLSAAAAVPTRRTKVLTLKPITFALPRIVSKVPSNSECSNFFFFNECVMIASSRISFEHRLKASKSGCLMMSLTS